MRKNFGAKSWMYPMPVLIIGTYDESGTPDAMNAAWGMISPRKPTNPAKLTAAPAMQAAQSRKANLYFFTGTPSAKAVSSPSASNSSTSERISTYAAAAVISIMAG